MFVPFPSVSWRTHSSVSFRGAQEGAAGATVSSGLLASEDEVATADGMVVIERDAFSEVVASSGVCVP